MKLKVEDKVTKSRKMLCWAVYRKRMRLTLRIRDGVRSSACEARVVRCCIQLTVIEDISFKMSVKIIRKVEGQIVLNCERR